MLLEPVAVNACFAFLPSLSSALLSSPLSPPLLRSAAVDVPHGGALSQTRLSGGDLSVSLSFPHRFFPF